MLNAAFDLPTSTSPFYCILTSTSGRLACANEIALGVGGTMKDDRRNRLGNPSFPDEPDEGFKAYQKILDSAYELKAGGKLDEVYALLLPRYHGRMAGYQRARTEFLFGEYWRVVHGRQQHAAGDPETNEVHPDSLGEAAECYRRGAEAAARIPDMPMFAQLKSLESSVCWSSNPYRKRYRRAFEAARGALDAWRMLPPCSEHDLAYIEFEFNLAEDLGVRAQMVAEDTIAVDALNRAAVLLERLHRHIDANSPKYRKHDLYLEWDWAALDRSIGDYALAFKRALKARTLAERFPDLRNFGRINTLIADIAVDCADAGIEPQRYSRSRLLSVAEDAVEKAMAASDQNNDKAGFALALLAKVRFRRLDEPDARDERVNMLTEAYKYAASVEGEDPVLLARVEMAIGDGYAWRYWRRRSNSNLEEARRYYEQALTRLKSVEAFGLARMARHRLFALPPSSRLPPNSGPTSETKRPTSPPDGDISPN